MFKVHPILLHRDVFAALASLLLASRRDNGGVGEGRRSPNLTGVVERSVNPIRVASLAIRGCQNARQRSLLLKISFQPNCVATAIRINNEAKAPVARTRRNRHRVIAGRNASHGLIVDSIRRPVDEEVPTILCCLWRNARPLLLMVGGGWGKAGMRTACVVCEILRGRLIGVIKGD